MRERFLCERGKGFALKREERVTFSEYKRKGLCVKGGGERRVLC